MNGISTHVLDTSRGRPAAGVPVVLERRVSDTAWAIVGSGETDAEGRLRTLLPADAPLVAGTYRLTFDTIRYFDGAGIRPFFPVVAITFEAAQGETHYHVPLLVSPFGYTTYRGS